MFTDTIQTEFIYRGEIFHGNINLLLPTTPLRYCHAAKQPVNISVPAEENFPGVTETSRLAKLPENECSQVVKETETASLGPSNHPSLCYKGRLGQTDWCRTRKEEESPGKHLMPLSVNHCQ